MAMQPYKILEKFGRNEVCIFCKEAYADELVYGAIYKQGKVVVHYFCLLLSSQVSQAGEDEEGILGFLPQDIVKGAQKSSTILCAFCNHLGANIRCASSSCSVKFHLPCGLERGTTHQFYGEFKSFCPRHRFRQWIPAYVSKSIKKKKLTCGVCFDDVEKIDSDVMWAPCCKKNGFFHKKCLQKMAYTFGSYTLKCPLCNDKTKFLQAVERFGIYIPQQDAAWESVPNAFGELLERYSNCDAETCLCLKGRKYSDESTSWKIHLCVDCGSQGIHRKCLKMRSPNNWKCEICDRTKPLSVKTATVSATLTDKVTPVVSVSNVQDKSRETDVDVGVHKKTGPKTSVATRTSSTNKAVVGFGGNTSEDSSLDMEVDVVSTEEENSKTTVFKICVKEKLPPTNLLRTRTIDLDSDSDSNGKPPAHSLLRTRTIDSSSSRSSDRNTVSSRKRSARKRSASHVSPQKETVENNCEQNSESVEGRYGLGQNKRRRTASSTATSTASTVTTDVESRSSSSNEAPPKNTNQVNIWTTQKQEPVESIVIDSDDDVICLDSDDDDCVATSSIDKLKNLVELEVVTLYSNGTPNPNASRLSDDARCDNNNRNFVTKMNSTPLKSKSKENRVVIGRIGTSELYQVMSVRSPSIQSSQIKIFGNEYASKIIKMIADEMVIEKVMGILKAGARFANICENVLSECQDFERKDLIVLIGGSNDIDSETFLEFLETLLSNLTHTNVLIVNIPRRFDLRFYSEINCAIARINSEIEDICNKFSNVKICNVNNMEKSFYSRSGRCFSSRGRQHIVQCIYKAIAEATTCKQENQQTND